MLSRYTHAVSDVSNEMIGAAEWFLTDIAAEQTLVQVHDRVVFVQFVQSVETLVTQ